MDSSEEEHTSREKKGSSEEETTEDYKTSSPITIISSRKKKAISTSSSLNSASNSPRSPGSSGRLSRRGSLFSTSPRRRGSSLLMKTFSRRGSSEEEDDLPPVCDFEEGELVRIFGLHFSPYHGEFLPGPLKTVSRSVRPASTSNLVKSAKKRLEFNLVDSEGDESEVEDEDDEGHMVPIRKSSFAKRTGYNVASAFDKLKAFGGKKSGKSSQQKSRPSTPVSSPEIKRKKRDERKVVPFNEIIKGTIFLGVQPQSSAYHPFVKLNGKRGHPHYDINSDLLGKGTAQDIICALVCTIQEAYEMGGSVVNNNKFNKPIDHNIFARYGIGNIWMLMVDEQGELKFEMALYRMYDLMEAFLDYLPLYIHCKSGKGRSVMLVILLFGFCFMLWHRETCFDVKEETKFSTEKTRKITRLLQVINVITEAKLDDRKFPKFKEQLAKVNEFFGESKDKPTEDIIRALVDVCENFIASIRVIKLGSEKRETSFLLLRELAERVYGETNTAHSRFKSPDCAFLDDLGQTAAYKNICIFMAAKKNEGNPECYAFQLFLNRLVRNKKGWFSEIQSAVDHPDINKERKCSSFVGIAYEIRLLVEKFFEAIKDLSIKHPSSNYSQHYLEYAKANKDESKPKASGVVLGGYAPGSEIREKLSLPPVKSGSLSKIQKLGEGDNGDKPRPRFSTGRQRSTPVIVRSNESSPTKKISRFQISERRTSLGKDDKKEIIEELDSSGIIDITTLINAGSTEKRDVSPRDHSEGISMSAGFGESKDEDSSSSHSYG